MRSFSGAARLHLVLLAAILSAASCTAILGIGGDFKQGAGGSTSASTSSGHGGGAGATSGSQSSSSQGSGGATSSASTANGGSGGSGGNDTACLNCIAQQCTMQLGTCTGDTHDCSLWYGCLATCHNSAEATTCDQSYSSASPDYTPVYICAASLCANQCAVLDPGKHPCTDEVIYGTDAGLFCPFADPDGGAVFCTQGAHCCQQTTLDGGAQCQGATNGCNDMSGDYDWRCAGPGNCSGATDTCCTSGPGHITFEDSPQCETKVGNAISGTNCQAACNAAQGQYQVCTGNADCTAPQKCWAVAAHGFKIGVCH